MVSCQLLQEICFKIKISSCCIYPFRKMVRFDNTSQRFKVQLASPVAITMVFKMAVLTLKSVNRHDCNFEKSIESKLYKTMLINYLIVVKITESRKKLMRLQRRLADLVHYPKITSHLNTFPKCQPIIDTMNRYLITA